MKQVFRQSSGRIAGMVGAMVLGMGSMAIAQDFTAYNDLAWATGQLQTNITRITSPVGGSGLPDTGQLVDFDTGDPTGVTLTVTGGTFDGDNQGSQGADPTTGDAFTIFDGNVNGQGAISYINDENNNLVLTFTGMDPEKMYDLTFFAHRADHGWTRASLVTISGADEFTNTSSAATDNPDTTNYPGGVIFTGPTSPSTRMPADNPNGYVARFSNVDPGADGEVVLTVSFDGDPAQQWTGKYGSAVRLVESSAAVTSNQHDLNGDGQADLVWRNTSNGTTAIWLMNGAAVASTGFPGGVSSVWQIEGVGDVNNDGNADVVWRNTTNGTVAIWLMNGTTVTSTGFPGSAPTDWEIHAVGDVDGNGNADLIWRNTNTGATALWLLNGAAIASTGFPGGVPTAWQIEGAGDVNGDGTADVVWRNTTNGTVAIWLMNGTTVTSTGFPGSAPTAYEIHGVGDVDGDGNADLVWRNTSSGVTAVWFMNGAAIASSGFPGGVPLAWHIEQVSDVDANGKADVVWRNENTGTVAVWIMDGLTITTTGFPGSAPTEWEIQN